MESVCIKIEWGLIPRILEKWPRLRLLPWGDKLESALAMVVVSQANLLFKAKLNNIYSTDARSPEKSKSLPLVGYEEISISCRDEAQREALKRIGFVKNCW